MEDSGPDILALLQVLHDFGVDFIIVGALSAVLQGAPVMTFDVDIVHLRTPENIRRLLEALHEIEATYRGPPAALSPTSSHLESPGHQLLSTRFGPLDILGAIEEGLDYEALLPSSRTLELDDLALNVLSLKKYVELKELSTREKDRARLPLLRRVLMDKDP